MGFKEDVMTLYTSSCNYKKDLPSLEHISISTITYICDLHCGINIKNLKDEFESPIHPTCDIVIAKEHNEYELTKRGRVIKSFYNQITIKYNDHTTKSIKVFSNGRLQITGITSEYEANRTVDIVCGIISKTQDFQPKARNIWIGMINTNFSFGVNIDIKKTLKLLKETSSVKAVYSPDVYPGIKVKHHNTSIFVFRTGKVVITGAKTLKEINEGFNTIIDIIGTNIKQVQSNVCTHVPQKQKAVYKSIHGYPEHVFKSCA